MPHSPITYARNPLSGEVKRCTRAEARRLFSYGWTRSTSDEYTAYIAAVQSYTVLKHATKIVRH